MEEMSSRYGGIEAPDGSGGLQLALSNVDKGVVYLDVTPLVRRQSSPQVAALKLVESIGRAIPGVKASVDEDTLEMEFFNRKKNVWFNVSVRMNERKSVVVKVEWSQGVCVELCLRRAVL